MTTLEVNGHQVEVDDSFMKLSPDDQQKTVTQIATSLQAKAPEDTSSRPVGVNFLRGIPIAGAYADKATAALNAAAQPILETGLSHAPTYGERYTENEQRVREGTDKWSAQHPVESTVDQLLGGTAAFAPIGASAGAARVLGLSGTLPQMVGRGIASGGAIGAADAAARGGDVATGAGIGAATGAGLPVVGRAIGAGYGAARRALTAGVREAPTVNIAGVEVPQRASAVAPDAAAAQRAGDIEQQAISGVSGPEAQQIAQQATDLQGERMGQATQSFSNRLSPATDPRIGAVPEPGAQDAAHNQFITEAASMQNEAMRDRALSGVANEAERYQGRQAIQPGEAVPSNDAAQQLLQSVRERGQERAAARTAAYDEAGAVPGQYNPAGFHNVSRSLQQRMRAGSDRFRVDDQSPVTRNALEFIESEIGSGRQPQNMLDPQRTNYNDALASGVAMQPPPPITGQDVEAVRKGLVRYRSAANAKARQGDGTDAMGMRLLMEHFDNHVGDVINAGGFSGDGADLLRKYAAARAAHAQYRTDFSSRGAGDAVGPTMEKAIGKIPGQEMDPREFASALFGNENGAGGGKQSNLAQHMVRVFGADSPQADLMRRAALSHVMDGGVHGDLPPGQAASNLRELMGGKGSQLARHLFTDEQRNNALAHADFLDSIVPGKQKPNQIQRQMLALSGADGGQPASAATAVKMLRSSGGTAEERAALATELKKRLSPESWDHLRQEAFKSVTQKAEGVTEWGPRQLSNNLGNFLADPVTKQLYSEKEQQMLRIIQQEYERQVPRPYTTNNSGSAIMGGKMMKSAARNFFSMIGLASHGPMGYAAGHAADRGLTFVSNRRAARAAADVFLGKEVKPEYDHSPNMQRAAAILSKASIPIGGQQQSNGR